jgi:hypothetical protein
MVQKQDILMPEMPVEVKSFLESLLDEAKLEKTDPILKEMMLGDLFERFQHHIILTLAKHLTDDQMETYAKMAAVSQTEAIKFVQEVRPDTPQILFDAMGEFRKIFLKQK